MSILIGSVDKYAKLGLKKCQNSHRDPQEVDKIETPKEATSPRKQKAVSVGPVITQPAGKLINMCFYTSFRIKPKPIQNS